MDKSDKKRLRQQWRDQQRAAARDALPLRPNELKALFNYLDEELPRRGCDRTRRLTESWLREHQHEVQPVFEWLDDNGGFCDCEVLANSEPSFDDAKRSGGTL